MKNKFIKKLLAYFCLTIMLTSMVTACDSENGGSSESQQITTTVKEGDKTVEQTTTAKEKVTTTEPVSEKNAALEDHSYKAKDFINITDSKVLAERNKERALSMTEQYYKDFFIPDSGFLKLFYPSEKRNGVEQVPKPATCWEYGALMSMQSQLAIMDKSQIPMLDVVNEKLAYYGYLKDDKRWAYVVHRGYKPMGATDPGLAYDDLEWLVINFLRSYEVTDNKEYLSEAEYLMNFVLDEAWFEPLGGLFWDTRHEARHSCSNNPAIKPLVDLYNHTGKKEYLDWAKKVFDFSLILKNDEKNIYEDLIWPKQDENGVWQEGVAGGGYYSYNTGTMISAGAALYGETGEQRYLDEALDAAKGAYEHFAVKVGENVTYWPCTSNIWFNNILLRGYIDLYKYAPEEAEFYINTFQNSMDFAYDNYLYQNYLPINWAIGWGSQERDKDYTMHSLDHTANIEMYAMLANWQADKSQS